MKHTKNKLKHRPLSLSGKPAVKKKQKTSRRQRSSTPRMRRNRHSLPTHKRVLLHPISIMVLLCCGVLIVGWTVRVVASSYTVSAVVPAPQLTQGAVITAPSTGAVISATPITVSGTCPLNSYVNLSLNNNFAGTAWCSQAQTFQIKTGLVLGTNVLTAQDYNVTDQPGPHTPSVTVTYSPQSATSNPTIPLVRQHVTSSSGSVTPPPPLLLVSDFHFQTFTTNEPFVWSINLKGGYAPYRVTIQWGDGQLSSMTPPAPTLLTLSHTYHHPGYYAVIVTATDASGYSQTLQLAALIKTPGAAGIYSSQPSQTNLFGSLFSISPAWLWVAWPFYLVVVLMATSFWLGEQQKKQKVAVRY